MTMSPVNTTFSNQKSQQRFARSEGLILEENLIPQQLKIVNENLSEDGNLSENASFLKDEENTLFESFHELDDVLYHENKGQRKEFEKDFIKLGTQSSSPFLERESFIPSRKSLAEDPKSRAFSRQSLAVGPLLSSSDSNSSLNTLARLKFNDPQKYVISHSFKKYK